MFSYIKGKLTHAANNTAIIESGGIGYDISVSLNTMLKLPPIDREVKLFTFMSVKEDGITLYGFDSLEEKNMFLKLTTISGIGPKMGMAILSGIDLSSLALAIISRDAKLLSTIKGVGKKTAERIILELKEKITADDSALPQDAYIAQPNGLDNDAADAVSALRTLGISQQDAYKAVQAAKPHSRTIEELIANALKNYS